MKNDKRNGKKHIPPHDVVERLFCSSKATRGEDVQVEHLVCYGYSPAFDFHPILPCMRGLTLIRSQVVQVHEPRQKRLLTATWMVQPFHREHAR